MSRKLAILTLNRAVQSNFSWYASIRNVYNHPSDREYLTYYRPFESKIYALYI